MGVHKKRKTPEHAPTGAILESISDGVFTVDMDWRVTSFNRAAEEITGVSRQEAIGRRCSDVFRSSMCEDACALQETLKTGKPIIGKSGYIINQEGNRIPISVSTAVLRESDGRVIGGAETFRDFSELEALRQELAGKYQVGDLTSRSPLMQRLLRVLQERTFEPLGGIRSETADIRVIVATNQDLMEHWIKIPLPCRGVGDNVHDF